MAELQNVWSDLCEKKTKSEIIQRRHHLERKIRARQPIDCHYELITNDHMLYVTMVLAIVRALASSHSHHSGISIFLLFFFPFAAILSYSSVITDNTQIIFRHSLSEWDSVEQLSAVMRFVSHCQC